MKKYLTILLFLTSLIAQAQIQARYDIEYTTYVDDTTWTTYGKIVDATGSYNGLSVAVGDKIIQRGVSNTSITVFDRFKIVEILSADVNYLEVNVRSDMDSVLNNSGGPLTGAFPIGSPVDTTKLTLKPSMYQTNIDPDYDAGVDNLNLRAIQSYLGSGTSPQWRTSGANIYNTNSGNVGIGTTAPTMKFEVYSSDPSDNIYSRIKTSDYSSQLFNRVAYSGRPDSILNESEILTSSSGVRFGLTSYYNDWKAWFNLTPDTMSLIPYITDKDGNAMIGRLGLGTNLSPWGDTYLSKLYLKTPRYSATSTRTLGIDTVTGELVKIPNATASDTNFFAKSGSNIWAKNTGNIGFGVTNPSYKVDVLTSGVVGVYAKSTSAGGNNPYGVWGESAGMGVFGSGGKYGFYGSGTIAGVYGSSTSAAGVYGETSTNRGVIGVATGSGGWGVTGTSDLSYGVVAYSGSNIPIYVWTSPASTNTSIPIITLARMTNGTASTGIGGLIKFEIENTGGTGIESARIGSVLSRVSAGSESSSIEFWTRKNGTLAKKAEIDSTGSLTLSGSGAILDLAGDKMRIRTSKTPSSATDTGNAGDWCWDASYIYICTATNTWKRTAISTW